MNFDLARAIAGLYKHRDKNSELLAKTVGLV